MYARDDVGREGLTHLLRVECGTAHTHGRFAFSFVRKLHSNVYTAYVCSAETSVHLCLLCNYLQ